jgi:hypothetical protein
MEFSRVHHAGIIESAAAAAAAVMIIHLSVSIGRKKRRVGERRSTSEMSSLDDVLSFIFVFFKNSQIFGLSAEM